MYGDDHIINVVEYFHDVCVVWAPQIPVFSHCSCRHSELGDRLFRILLSGSRQPNRKLPVFDGAAEDDARNHYLVRLLFLFLSVSSRTAENKPANRVCFHCSGCVLYFFKLGIRGDQETGIQEGAAGVNFSRNSRDFFGSMVGWLRCSSRSDSCSLSSLNCSQLRLVK